jgi:uncharacterized membrane protein
MKHELKSFLLGLGILSLGSLVILLMTQFPVLVAVITVLISSWAIGAALRGNPGINHLKSFLLGLVILAGFIGLGVAASYFPIIFLVLSGIFFAWALGTIVRM